MIDVVLRYSNHALLLDKLDALGVPVRRSTPILKTPAWDEEVVHYDWQDLGEKDEEGNVVLNPVKVVDSIIHHPDVWIESVPVEEQIARCSTPEQVTHQGNVRTIRLHESEAALIPEITSPDFLCDWRSDEENAPEDWPSYTYDATDIDGNLYIGTVQAGRIG